AAAVPGSAASRGSAGKPGAGSSDRSAGGGGGGGTGGRTGGEAAPGGIHTAVGHGPGRESRWVRRPNQMPARTATGDASAMRHAVNSAAGNSTTNITGMQTSTAAGTPTDC